MANGTTTTPTGSGSSPSVYNAFLQQTGADGSPTTQDFNYDAFQQAIGDISQQIGTVTTVPPPDPGQYGDDPRVQAALESYGTQQETLQKQADKAATSLEAMGAGFTTAMQSLSALRSDAGELLGSANEAWGAAAEKAEEYVGDARARVSATLATLEGIYQDITEGWDSDKAHAMQVAVQSVSGQVREAVRKATELYGVGSKEAQQAYAQGQTTLANVQSSIHAQFRNLRTTMDTTYLSATNEALWKTNMYASFQEQQHVETLRYMAQSSAEYSLQLGAFQLSIDQLMMSGLENIANWIVQTPVFAMDNQGIITLISEVAAERMALEKMQSEEERLRAAQDMEMWQAMNQAGGTLGYNKAVSHKFILPAPYSMQERVTT